MILRSLEISEKNVVDCWEFDSDSHKPLGLPLGVMIHDADDDDPVDVCREFSAISVLLVILEVKHEVIRSASEFAEFHMTSRPS